MPLEERASMAGQFTEMTGLVSGHGLSRADSGSIFWALAPDLAPPAHVLVILPKGQGLKPILFT
jgi:hypothetical protein